jgi:hypothetical protein
MTPSLALLAALLAAPPAITLANGSGTAVPLVVEDTSGITDRPLVKTAERMKTKIGHDFLFLDKIDVKDGTALVGRYTVTVDDGPLRLTVYEITKQKNGDRMLRVLASGYYKSGDVAEFKATAIAAEEDVYLVSAEATASATDLNPHLRYMNAQGNEIVVKGFSTNWNLSQLKLKLAAKETPASKANPANDAEFTKDADWLVDNMIAPRWVVSVRIH